MNYVLYSLITSACVLTQSLYAETGTPPPTQQETKKALSWLTNYEKAIEMAKKENKPLFLYFTGSDWCGWCFKMDKEVLNTTDFAAAVGSKFIFVDIDFPIYKTQDPALIKQNEALKEKFSINGFPTIIILTPDLKQIATLNYKPGGGKAYADHLLNLLDQYQNFNQGMKTLDKQSTSQLETLYHESQKLGQSDAGFEIIQLGLAREDNLFFLKEYYRHLMTEGKITHPTVQKVRDQLLSKDPQNKNQIHYDVAIIDFEALAANLHNERSANNTVRPLQDYLAKFGNQDSTNRWRVEMIISQVFNSKNQFDQALKYAKLSKDHAPQTVQPSIESAIVALEQDANSTTAQEEH